MIRLSFLTLVLLGLFASPSPADFLLLKDGRILERPSMERVEGGVKVFFENGEVVVPEDRIQDAILLREPPPEPKTEKEKEKIAKGLVLYEGRWVKPEKRMDLVERKVAERKAYIDELRAMSRWRDRGKEETKHFAFEYTVPPFVFEYFRDLTEAYYKEFAKTWKIRPDKKDGKLTICFYTDIDAFHQIGGVGGGVQGYFRFVKPWELNFFYERRDPYHAEQVMYHELNHYLQLLMDTDFNMPHFPGEAIAEYYGASRFDPKTKKLETGLVLEGRLVEIKNDIAAGDIMPLEKMLRADEMYEHYTWGWSLAHFLMSDKRYQKKFVKFVKDLVAGKGVKHVPSMGRMKTVRGDEVFAHFKRSLGIKKQEDLEALEKEWHEYVTEELKFVTARGLEKAAASAQRSGRPLRAKRLFKEAIDKGSTDAMTYHRFGELLERDGKRDEAIALFGKAVELAPLEATFYESLGRALVRKGEKEEGLRLLKLALELDPGNASVELSIENFMESEGG